MRLLSILKNQKGKHTLDYISGYWFPMFESYLIFDDRSSKEADFELIKDSMSHLTVTSNALSKEENIGTKIA